MRVSSAAIGLAAVGAGLLVARMVMRREERPDASPPDPNQLIGYPRSNLSAAEAAEVLENAPQRPM
ncbi:MAG: hypothetical protein ACM33T_08960 [Solirubrobacterales bacterium]